MRKYQMMVNRKQETGEAGLQLLYKIEGRIGRQDLEHMEEKLDTMRTTLNNESLRDEKLGRKLMGTQDEISIQMDQ
eukprot:6178384-Heterocapsa_arctica.AAC.1